MMQKKTVAITAVGYGLSLIYGVGLAVYLGAFAVSFVDKEALTQYPVLFSSQFRTIEEFQIHAVTLSILFFLQLVAFFGVLLMKDWGRRLVILLGIGTCVYVLARMVFVLRAVDSLSLAVVGVYAGVIAFFRWSKVREQFTDSGGPKGKTVLLVDDDKGLLTLVKTTLGKRGLRVLTATTGEKGLAMARQKPDLIILDVLLPGIKGRQVCARLKSDSATKDIPVLFLTAKDSPDDVQAEIEAGAMGHLTKPLSPDSLLLEVRKILNV